MGTKKRYPDIWQGGRVWIGSWTVPMALDSLDGLGLRRGSWTALKAWMASGSLGLRVVWDGLTGRRPFRDGDGDVLSFSCAIRAPAHPPDETGPRGAG